IALADLIKAAPFATLGTALHDSPVERPSRLAISSSMLVNAGAGRACLSAGTIFNSGTGSMGNSRAVLGGAGGGVTSRSNAGQTGGVGSGTGAEVKRGPGGGTGSTGLIGRRSAASSRCAISARLDSSLWAGRDGSGGAAGMCFGSGVGGIWNAGSNGGGAGGGKGHRPGGFHPRGWAGARRGGAPDPRGGCCFGGLAPPPAPL